MIDCINEWNKNSEEKLLFSAGLGLGLGLQNSENHWLSLLYLVQMISSLAWVPKGAPRQHPVRFELSPEEYARVKSLAK